MACAHAESARVLSPAGSLHRVPGEADALPQAVRLQHEEGRGLRPHLRAHRRQRAQETRCVALASFFPHYHPAPDCTFATTQSCAPARAPPALSS
eukprot:2851049-Prymnesium_polylepis.1